MSGVNQNPDFFLEAENVSALVGFDENNNSFNISFPISIIYNSLNFWQTVFHLFKEKHPIVTPFIKKLNRQLDFILGLWKQETNFMHIIIY